MLIITYDEHGGFFDHCQPIALETAAPHDEYPVFTTSGLRVPGIIVSPLVSAGSCYSENLDHISILKLLGQKFGQGGGYSTEVDRRAVQSVAAVLDLTNPRADCPPPPDPATFPKDTAPPLPSPGNVNAEAFHNAADAVKRQYPHELASKFPAKRDFLGV